MKRLIIKMLKILWPQYMRSEHVHLNYKKIFFHFFIQKIMRINANVPWPVHPTSKVVAPKNIKRGTRTPALSRNCYLDARNGIEFGKNVWIGPYVNIISQNHALDNYSIYIEDNPIIIGNNCWIGAKAIILPGVKLADHVVVAAGSIVTKSFETSDILIGGNPAKIIKKIDPYKK